MKTGTFRFAKTNGFQREEQLRVQHETDRKFAYRLKKVKSELTRQHLLNGTNSSWHQIGANNTASSTASNFRVKEVSEHPQTTDPSRERQALHPSATLASFRRRPRDFEVWFDENKAKPLKVPKPGKNLYGFQIKVKQSQRQGMDSQEPKKSISGSARATASLFGGSAGMQGTSSDKNSKADVAGHKKVKPPSNGLGPLPQDQVQEETQDDDESREISYQLKHRARYVLLVSGLRVPVELGDTCIWQEVTDDSADANHVVVLELSEFHGEQKKKVRVCHQSRLEYVGKGLCLKVWLADRKTGGIHLCSRLLN